MRMTTLSGCSDQQESTEEVRKYYEEICPVSGLQGVPGKGVYEHAGGTHQDQGRVGNGKRFAAR